MPVGSTSAPLAGNRSNHFFLTPSLTHSFRIPHAFSSPHHSIPSFSPTHTLYSGQRPSSSIPSHACIFIHAVRHVIPIMTSENILLRMGHQIMHHTLSLCTHTRITIRYNFVATEAFLGLVTVGGAKSCMSETNSLHPLFLARVMHLVWEANNGFIPIVGFIRGETEDSNSKEISKTRTGERQRQRHSSVLRLTGNKQGLVAEWSVLEDFIYKDFLISSYS
ncbi:unnamed protein product [Sphenostylis stenocarpa]|uniref:Uncharacterized protein n=1 Tax=Sphenostylis stenocarpa TaxID=92480 RepID=A0AA86W307_9FABA|nr:unnamed protein product [Sphenostylis stenocarpa]